MRIFIPVVLLSSRCSLTKYREFSKLVLSSLCGLPHPRWFGSVQISSPYKLIRLKMYTFRRYLRFVAQSCLRHWLYTQCTHPTVALSTNHVWCRRNCSHAHVHGQRHIHTHTLVSMKSQHNPLCYHTSTALVKLSRASNIQR